MEPETDVPLGVGTDPALLVVDVARSKADPDVDSSTSAVTEATENMRDLVGVARDADVPVYYTLGGLSSHVSSAAGLTDVERGGWGKQNDVREETAEEARRHETLSDAFETRDDEVVIHKHGPSAFFKTMLPVYLSTQGVDTLIVTGITASGCVRATVVDGFSHDYHVVVPRECVADTRPEVTDFHLDEMDYKYADTASQETVEAYLRSL
jgi:nicotinamidase-related amidase